MLNPSTLGFHLISIPLSFHIAHSRFLRLFFLYSQSATTFEMRRARLPSLYAKVQIGLHALALFFAIAAICAAIYVASQGHGYGGAVALAFVAVSFGFSYSC